MKTLFLTLLIISGLTAGAKTYYLSADGNDANSGTTTSTPWKSLNKLNASFNSLVSDDYVFLTAVMYFMELLCQPRDSQRDIR
ncbi:MAG: hypothetical protein ABI416_13680 [Ginsengibacter sp.]